MVGWVVIKSPSIQAIARRFLGYGDLCSSVFLLVGVSGSAELGLRQRVGGSAKPKSTLHRMFLIVRDCLFNGCTCNSLHRHGG